MGGKRDTQTEKEGEQGKQKQATQDLEINVVPLALAIWNDSLVGEWLFFFFGVGVGVLIF